jgi:RNA polymerase sigma-70 factor (ECF subfamily)
VVLAAGEHDTRQSFQALEQLCRTYWYPLYAFVRRRGYGPHDAEDLTQGFFARLVDKNYLEQVTPEKGKFRTFLLCALSHFLANEWDRSHRLKRGGAVTFLPLETGQAEERFSVEATQAEVPERAFDRRWAETMLNVVLGRLRAELDDSGKSTRFDELKRFLLREPAAGEYARVAGRLQLREAGVQSAVHRLRKRFGELFREEVGHTVATRAAIDEELRYLIELMAS